MFWPPCALLLPAQTFCLNKYDSKMVLSTFSKTLIIHCILTNFDSLSIFLSAPCCGERCAAQMSMRGGKRRFGEAAEHPSRASSDPIITPCISQALWPLWRLQRICEWRRNPSRVMVLLYALRPAIFNPYPSCLSYKLCNHGPLCRQQAGPTQRVCGLHALFKKESGVLL